jgi:hypothetical protein
VGEAFGDDEQLVVARVPRIGRPMTLLFASPHPDLIASDSLLQQRRVKTECRDAVKRLLVRCAVLLGSRSCAYA